MTKVEASTLEEAYAKASEILACSVSDLQYEVVQHPSRGILGFMKKSAIIVATCKNKSSSTASVKEISSSVEPASHESVATEIVTAIKEENSYDDVVIKEDAIVNTFFNNDDSAEDTIKENQEDIVYDELALLIENQLKDLLDKSCFNIDIVEVDVRDNTALIFIDGEDAALLIGKEGYRYNALSYMLFNWLHTRYELFIKLEIAEFLTKQQEMIRHYLLPVIENVEKRGRAKTRFLDGILVQIALEQLREKFPNKYVAVKTSRDGKKFVVINEFNTKLDA